MAKPSRSDRTRPAELIGLAAVFALFAGVIVFMSTRTWDVSLISTGIGFIVALVLLAMLALAAGPIGQEKDLLGGDPHATGPDEGSPTTGAAEPERKNPPTHG